MLVLTRYKGEKITVGDNAEIQFTILDIHDGQIKVGIDAPQEIAVHRNEVYQKIKAKNN